MDQQVEELTALLERQAELYDRIALILVKEKAAAVAALPAALEDARLAKEPLIEALADAEKARVDLVGRLAQNAGMDAGAVTVTALARHLGGPLGQRLHQCRQALGQRLEAVGRLNQEVGDLLGCGLRLVRGTMALVTQMTQPDRIYHRSGRFVRNAGSGRIVSGNI